MTETMTSPTLEQMPLEVLDRILSFASDPWSRRTTYSSLSTVCRRFVSRYFEAKAFWLMPLSV